MSKSGSILGCLKLSWAVFGAILAPGQKHGQKHGQNMAKKFGSDRLFLLLLDHFDTHLDYFLEDVGMILWTIFLSLFGPLLGTILGPIFGPELQRPKKLHFQNP